MGIPVLGLKKEKEEGLEERLSAFNSGHYVKACGWNKVEIVKNMLPDNIDWEDSELKEIIDRCK